MRSRSRDSASRCDVSASCADSSVSSAGGRPVRRRSRPRPAARVASWTRSRALDRLPRDHEREHQRHQPGDSDHPEHDLEVVLRQEHRPGGADDRRPPSRRPRPAPRSRTPIAASDAATHMGDAQPDQTRRRPPSAAAMRDHFPRCHESTLGSHRYPTPQTVTSRLGRGRVGLDLLAQPPHVDGHRGLVAERPAPDLLQQLDAGEGDARDWRRGTAAGRTRARSARAARPPCVTCRLGPSITQVAVDQHALVRRWSPRPTRRSTDDTRSTSSRGLNGLVT